MDPISTLFEFSYAKWDMTKPETRMDLQRDRDQIMNRYAITIPATRLYQLLVRVEVISPELKLPFSSLGPIAFRIFAGSTKPGKDILLQPASVSKGVLNLHPYATRIEQRTDISFLQERLDIFCDTIIVIGEFYGELYPEKLTFGMQVFQI